MNNIPILIFFIYSAFTVNLLLQCGLGIKGAVDSKNTLDISSLIKISIIFASVIILWLFFSKILFSLLPGIYIYIILFPISYIVYDAMEYLVFYYILKKDRTSESLINFPGGITAVAVFLNMYLANNFLQTIVLSFGFTAGLFMAKLIIREIRKRAAFEAVPVYIRGIPLVLITMGMLSLVFTTASLLLFRMIGIR